MALQTAEMHFKGLADSLALFQVVTCFQLRRVCVELLPRNPLSPDTAFSTNGRLMQLQATLQSLPSELLDGAMLDYAFFPLSQLLRINSLDVFAGFESVLERIMQNIAAIVRPWRRTVKSMQSDLIQQIWLVCVLILGGPIDGKGKGKKHTWSDETERATLRALIALLEPVKADQDSLISPAMPLLAHSIIALLDLAEGSSDDDVCITALEALHALMARFLTKTDPKGVPLLAHFFPGCVSTLSRILAPKQVGRTHTRNRPSMLLSPAIRLLRFTIVTVLGNTVSQHILAGRSGISDATRLEDLANETTEPMVVEESVDVGLGSHTWLKATWGQTHLAITSFGAAMRDHHTPAVRSDYANLVGALLTDCSKTCEERTERLALVDLVILTCDDLPEVSRAALAELGRAGSISEALSKLLSDGLQSLPQLIISHGDDDIKIARAAALLQGAASALTSEETASLFADLSRKAERWSISLLYALEFAISELSSRATNQSRITRPWMIAESTFDQMQVDATVSWPPLSFKRMPSIQSGARLRRAFVEVGRASLGESRAQKPVLVDYFISLAVGGLSAKQKAAAWWLLDAVLEALVPLADYAAPQKRRAARNVCQAVLNMADSSSEEITTGRTAPNTDDTASLVPLEKIRGTGAIGARLDEFSGKGASENYLESGLRDLQATRIITLCLSLRCLATAAAILQTSFRSRLMSTLYFVLANLNPTVHSLLQTHAERALMSIAESCGYAAVENLVLDNVDYVVNSVSQRLKLPRLDPAAPMVLITIIRLAGKEIIPLMHDVVDDVFDALDDFHEYDSLCASLLAVLDALIKATSTSVEMAPPLELAQHKKGPYPIKDLDDFEAWLKERARSAMQDNEEELRRSPPPQRSWASEAFEAEEKIPQPEEESDPPPNQAQAVCTAVLDKALHFISHDSAFLRARVLSLISSSVPVLADRKSDLMSVVHKAWPYILNRLSASEAPAVVVEAALLVEALGRYAGEFMSRKIVDNAWPRLRALLAQMHADDADAAVHGQFTRVQRIRLAILGTMTNVCAGVELQEQLVWELATSMRIFLNANEEIQGRAKRFYRQLWSQHPEVVWLALSGIVGGHENVLGCLEDLI